MNEKLPFRPNVCILLLNRDGKLFLGERKGSPGVWQFPQGGVEPDASLEENVLRELEEETGISRELARIQRKLRWCYAYDWLNPPDYAVGRWRGQSQTFWVVEFSGTDDDIDLNKHTPEFMNWCWCAIEEVRQLAEPRRFAGYEGALRELTSLIAQKSQ